MKKITIITVVFLCSIIAFSQDKNEGLEGLKKNAVSFNILGSSPILGVTYERILSEYMSIEIGIGNPGFGAGVKLMPPFLKSKLVA